MSEENTNEAPVTTSEAPAQESVSTEDLQNLVSDTFDSNEFGSSAENPEVDTDWGAEAIKNLEQTEEINGEEEAETDSEQQPDSDEEGSEEAEATDSEESSKEETSEESPDSEESEDTSSKLEIKVNGEVLELTLDEIKNDHPEVLESLKSGLSGAKEVAKRFSELDVEKKAFYAEKQEIEGYIQNFAETTKDGNILGGLTYFAEFANIPPYLLKEQLIAAIKPEIEKRSLMSADQVNNLRLHEENQYLTKKNESDQLKWQEEQAQQAQVAKQEELQNQINSIREAHSISDEEWDAAYATLDKSLPPEMEVIPLKAIEEQIISNRAEVATEQRLQDLVNPISDRVNDKFISELRTLIKDHPNLTDQDLNTVISDSLKLHEKRELEKNLQKKTLEKPKKLVKNDKQQSFKDLQDLIDWD